MGHTDVANSGAHNLVFTSKVLGADAAKLLKDRKVTQTIRSRRVAYPFFAMRGTRVNVVLDGEFLYPARITAVARKELRDLSQWDAEIGGFNNVDEMHKALKRAGFRFKDLNSYEAFRIEFLPLKEDGSK